MASWGCSLLIFDGWRAIFPSDGKVAFLGWSIRFPQEERCALATASEEACLYVGSQRIRCI